jgi:DNA polymerase-4
MLIELTNEVTERLHHEEQITKTITVQIKLPSFKLISRSFTLNDFIDSKEQIFIYVIDLYEKHFMNKDIRLIGVALSNLKLKKENYIMTSELFDDYMQQQNIIETKKDSLLELVDEINSKYSRNIINVAKKKLSK